LSRTVSPDGGPRGPVGLTAPAPFSPPAAGLLSGAMGDGNAVPKASQATAASRQARTDRKPSPDDIRRQSPRHRAAADRRAPIPDRRPPSAGRERQSPPAVGSAASETTCRDGGGDSKQHKQQSNLTPAQSPAYTSCKPGRRKAHDCKCCGRDILPLERPGWELRARAARSTRTRAGRTAQLPLKSSAKAAGRQVLRARGPRRAIWHRPCLC
jgi:hypothetical protein